MHRGVRGGRASGGAESQPAHLMVVAGTSAWRRRRRLPRLVLSKRHSLTRLGRLALEALIHISATHRVKQQAREECLRLALTHPRVFSCSSSRSLDLGERRPPFVLRLQKPSRGSAGSSSGSLYASGLSCALLLAPLREGDERTGDVSMPMLYAMRRSD